MRKNITVVGFSLSLLTGALAQIGPGGGPYGPPGGGWVIQFKGHLESDQGNVLWDCPAYTENPPITPQVRKTTDNKGTTGMGTYGSVGTYNGSVSMRLWWVGTGTPTPPPNFRVHSVAEGGAVYGETVSVSNGFSSASGPSASVDDLKLVQSHGSTGGETSVNITGNGIFGDFFVGAAIDSRYARVKASAIPDVYYVKGGDTEEIDNSLTSVLWDVTKTFPHPYTYSGQLWQDPIVASSGANRKEFRIVGLPEGFYDADASQWTKWNLLGNTFTGVVSSEHLSGESYTFTDGLSGTSVSETLPSFGPGWDVEPIGTINARGGYVTKNGSMLDRTEKADSSEQVKLHYHWTDGLEADSELQMVFMDRFSNRRLINAATIHEGGPHSYAFVDGFGGWGTTEWQPWEAGKARRVRWSNEQIAYKAAATVTAALGVVLPGTGASIASLIGVGLSLGSPQSGEGDLTPDPFSATDDPDGYRKHVYTFETQSIKDLYDAYGSNKDIFLASRTLWKAEYIPEKAVDIDLYDVYDVSGYAGVTKQRHEKPVPPLASQAKRFTYLVLENPS